MIGMSVRRFLPSIPMLFLVHSATGAENSVDFGSRRNLPGTSSIFKIAPKPPNAVHPPIVGPGTTPAPDSVFQLVVEVRYRGFGGEEFCTGTFVGRHQVLTAGHCGCGFPGTYEVHVGQTGADAVFPVAAVLLYDPRVCAGYDLHSRDLALLMTDSDLDCSGGAKMSRTNRADYKKPCPASGPALTMRQQFGGEMRSVWDLGQQLRRGQIVTAVGYGKSNAGTHSRRLMAPIPIMSPSCSDGHFPFICASFAEMLLVDPRNRGDDTCAGDSGGPVYLLNDATKAPELIATVSQAAPFMQGSNGCGGGGVYELLGRISVQAWLGANGVPDNTIIPAGQK